jgi:hypothetical protein
MAALFPQQEQQLRIKRPVRPRQWAEQPWADQFKQLHGTFLSVRIRIRFYCITSGRVCHKKAQKSPGSGCSPGQEDPGLFCGHLGSRRGAALRHRFFPPPEPGAPCPEHPVLRPWKEDAQFFSDFVPELLKITQFYHFFMLK